MDTWKPHEVKDTDKGKKIPKEKDCPVHGSYYGEFCLKCHMEKQGVRPNMEG